MSHVPASIAPFRSAVPVSGFASMGATIEAGLFVGDVWFVLPYVNGIETGAGGVCSVLTLPSLSCVHAASACSTGACVNTVASARTAMRPMRLRVRAMPSPMPAVSGISSPPLGRFPASSFVRSRLGLVVFVLCNHNFYVCCYFQFLNRVTEFSLGAFNIGG